MDFGLTGKICLVTGASTGIGKATAIALSAEGARIVASARSIQALDSLATEIVASGGEAPIVLGADIASQDGPNQLVDAVLREVDQIDILINNAGASRPLDRPDDQDVWDESFRLNFLAARRITERLVPAMAERGWGRIVNLSGAIAGKAFNAAAPAKAALESWSRATAAAYASRGVTVNCVAPGRISTPQILNVLHPSQESRHDFIARNIPAGRFGDAAEIAAVITFLASAPASYVNAVTVPVDGGAMRFSL